LDVSGCRISYEVTEQHDMGAIMLGRWIINLILNFKESY